MHCASPYFHGNVAVDYFVTNVQLVERACCYFCVQDWSAGIQDLNYVLVFVPVHVKALLLR